MIDDEEFWKWCGKIDEKMENIRTDLTECKVSIALLTKHVNDEIMLMKKRLELLETFKMEHKVEWSIWKKVMTFVTGGVALAIIAWIFDLLPRF